MASRRKENKDDDNKDVEDNPTNIGPGVTDYYEDAKEDQ